jgi:hypothetical protein
MVASADDEADDDDDADEDEDADAADDEDDVEAAQDGSRRSRWGQMNRRANAHETHAEQHETAQKTNVNERN